MPKIKIESEALVVVRPAVTMVYQPGEYAVPQAHADQIVVAGKGRVIDEEPVIIPPAPIAE
jgi:hypothetical protein